MFVIKKAGLLDTLSNKLRSKHLQACSGQRAQRAQPAQAGGYPYIFLQHQNRVLKFEIAFI